MNKMNNLFIPFTKSDDELRMVYGYASTEALDSQGEIIAREAIIEALPEYMKFGNIREMHQPSAVGKAHEATIDETGLFIGVKVVDESAWQKVKESVYNGFSIGGKIVTKVNDTITKLRLTEISLVDRPANPEAVFAFYKGEDMAIEKENNEDGVIVETTTPTEEVSKSVQSLNLLKSFMGEEVYDSRRALEALDIIMYLLGDEHRESENNPEQITALTAAIKAIKAFIVSEIQEDNGSGETIEAAEQTIELSDKNIDIAKAGASISGANKTKIENIMALCKELIGEEEEESDEAEKGVATDNLSKADDLQKSNDLLKGELDIAKSDLAKADERIKELEAMPVPPKGSLYAITKSDDISTPNEDINKAVVYDSKGDVNEVASLIKEIHKSA